MELSSVSYLGVVDVSMSSVSMANCDDAEAAACSGAILGYVYCCLNKGRIIAAQRTKSRSFFAKHSQIIATFILRITMIIEGAMEKGHKSTFPQ